MKRPGAIWCRQPVSTRAFNALEALGINEPADFFRVRPVDVLKVRGCGKHTLNELIALARECGVHFKPPVCANCKQPVHVPPWEPIRTPATPRAPLGVLVDEGSALPSQAIADPVYEALLAHANTARAEVGSDAVFVLSLQGNRVAVGVAHRAKSFDRVALAAAVRGLARRIEAGQVDEASPKEQLDS